MIISLQACEDKPQTHKSAGQRAEAAPRPNRYVRTPGPKTELTLTEQEGEQLVRWSRRAKSSQALALRSKIVLACAKGTDNKGVAAQL